MVLVRADESVRVVGTDAVSLHKFVRSHYPGPGIETFGLADAHFDSRSFSEGWCPGLRSAGTHLEAGVNP